MKIPGQTSGGAGRVGCVMSKQYLVVTYFYDGEVTAVDCGTDSVKARLVYMEKVREMDCGPLAQIDKVRLVRTIKEAVEKGVEVAK